MFSKFKADQKAAEEAWSREQPPPLGGFGSVDRLSVLPLVDWYTDSQELTGEAGVAYLVEAGEHRILFDVGANWKKEQPSPLLRNMKVLGVDSDAFEAVVISHAHLDHVGGLRPQRNRTFMLSPEDVDLTGRVAYVPRAMTHPTATVQLSEQPQVLFPGVATTGVIMRALWLMGLTAEQALAVNVRDKGIVLVVGCGHQGLSHLLERARRLFSQPLYGVIGGLHYPVTASRTRMPSQKIIGTGKLPWQRISKDEVREAIAELATANPGLVAISAHDSCDWTVSQFRAAFAGSYRDIAVGRAIEV